MFSIEAEMAVLGGMLIDPERISDACAVVEEWMFYREAHRRLFRGLTTLHEAGAKIDPVSLGDHLRSRRDMDAVGGLAYLAQLWDYVTTAANLEYHAAIVQRHAIRRRIHETAAKVQEFVRDTAEAPVEELQAEAERLIHEAASISARVGGFETAKDLIWPVMEGLERIEETPVHEWGVRTGLHAVDDRIGVVRRGDLVVLAGRPSMGKSAFAVCNIAADASIRQRQRTAIFSLETPKKGVINRLIGSEGRVNMNAIFKRRKVFDQELPRIGQAVGLISAAPLYIDHTPGLTLDLMRAKLRDLIREHGELARLPHPKMNPGLGKCTTSASNRHATSSATSFDAQRCRGDLGGTDARLRMHGHAIRFSPPTDGAVSGHRLLPSRH